MKLNRNKTLFTSKSGIYFYTYLKIIWTHHLILSISPRIVLPHFVFSRELVLDEKRISWLSLKLSKFHIFALKFQEFLITFEADFSSLSLYFISRLWWFCLSPSNNTLFQRTDCLQKNIKEKYQVWPHADFPLIPVGKLTLNRNPRNYFAEVSIHLLHLLHDYDYPHHQHHHCYYQPQYRLQVEQIAFSPAHLVPGIEPSPDKMLQVPINIIAIIIINHPK